VNLNDATTGHKLQGMTKKQLIILSWSYAFGWVYTCLSRVRTRDGLFLMFALILRGKKGANCVAVDGNLKWFEHRLQKKVPEDARQSDLQHDDVSMVNIEYQHDDVLMVDIEQSYEDCISDSSESESEDKTDE
jgi:hypothetical protein